jgi:malate dehydrogenase (quinone)
MLQVIQKCFGELLASESGSRAMKEMIPSYDIDLKLPSNADLYRQLDGQAEKNLNLL